MDASLEYLITFLAAVATFTSIVALALPFVQKDGLSSRLKAVAARREELNRQQKAKFQRGTRFQPKRHVNLMRSVLDRLNMQDLIASKALRQRMAQAGWRGQQAAVVFGFTRLALPMALGMLSLIVVSTSKNMTLEVPMRMMIVVAAMVIGYYLPMVILTNKIQTRQALIQKAFPDALDLLSICVEAGLSVEAAFGRVAEEIGDQSPILAEEFGLTTAELAFLGDRRLAYDGLAERTGLAATKSLATALVQSEKYGTPVTVSLRVLSQESRDTRMALAEKKAGSLPAQLTVPMIGCFLPVLFVVILGPAVMTIMAMKK
ncbi:MAG: type II secretion system F family protein [Alphaproteobacteria bacterium]|nr:type II secretion system F family protein [Alphaproteobacteria bacterium]MBF0129746.1 type II secretion system F family protein [Alphaproteobacteria bacterium]